MKSLRVYSRRGCHLCEVLIRELKPLIEGRLELEVRDIDTNPEWHEPRVRRSKAMLPQTFPWWNTRTPSSACIFSITTR